MSISDDYRKHYNKKRSELPLYFIVKQAKQRARKLNVPFDLNDTDILIPTHCPVLGIELQSSSDKSRDSSYSLDRVDPAKGYTKDNVRVISFRANVLKNSNTIETLERLIDYIRSNTDGGPSS